MLFRQTQLFQLGPSADDPYLDHTLAGRSDAFSPYQFGSSVSCLVYHVLPALDDFGHESPRKCAETTRCTTRTRKKQKTARFAVTGRFSAL